MGVVLSVCLTVAQDNHASENLFSFLLHLKQEVILPCSAQSLGSSVVLLQRKLNPSSTFFLAVVTHGYAGREQF